MLDQLSKNITRCGLSNSTLNYLRVSMWEERWVQLCSWGSGAWVAKSCALRCLTPGCPGVQGGSGTGSARAVLQMGCRERCRAVGLPEPVGSQHGVDQCKADGCPAEGLLLQPGAS